MIKFDKSLFDMICLPRTAAEALLGAPPACLKLYIYCILRDGAQDLGQAAQELNLPAPEVTDALQYLKIKGLLNMEDAENIELTYPEEKKEKAAVYCDAEEAAVLQSLFSDRLLSARDYLAINECTSVYGLNSDVVHVLIEYCIKTHRAKNRVPMSYIKKKALEWAEAGVDTVELAVKRSQSEMKDSGALKEILVMMGIRGRQPSAEEQKLYEKWTNVYGMDLDAITAAMPATLSAVNPSCKYLDRILTQLYNENKTSAEKIAESLTDRELTDDSIKMLLKELGAPNRTVTEAMRKRYMRFKYMGFSQETILLAAGEAVKSGVATMENVDMILSGWAGKGILKEEDILRFIENTQKNNERAKEFLSCLGVSRRPTSRDVSLINRCLRQGMTEETLMFAAKCAYGTASPMKYVQTILNSWQEAGVKTLSEAQAQNERHRVADKRQIYDERTYTEEELMSKVRDPLADL